MPDDDKNRYGGAVDNSADESRPRNEFGAALAMLSHMGVTIIACIGVGLAAGYFLDKLLGTSPWLLLLFILLGIIAAFKAIFDFAKKQ